MQEERRMILRMLEEGKITAEEAEALLNALGDAPGGSEEEPQEDPWVHLGKMGDDIASKVEAAAERFSRSLERTVRKSSPSCRSSWPSSPLEVLKKPRSSRRWCGAQWGLGRSYRST